MVWWQKKMINPYTPGRCLPEGTLTMFFLGTRYSIKLDQLISIDFQLISIYFNLHSVDFNWVSNDFNFDFQLMWIYFQLIDFNLLSIDFNWFSLDFNLRFQLTFNWFQFSLNLYMFNWLPTKIPTEIPKKDHRHGNSIGTTKNPIHPKEIP